MTSKYMKAGPETRYSLLSFGIREGGTGGVAT